MTTIKRQITIKFHRDGRLEIAVRHDGKPCDMSDPRNIANIAGDLAKTSVEMMKEFYRIKQKKNDPDVHHTQMRADP